MNFNLIFILIVWLLALVIHEVSHGWVAESLGDSTAKDLGRLSLNPLNHLDPIGSVLVPLFLFLSGSPILIGWAKPVPVNPYNLRDKKYGMLKVALAGPLANFIVAVFFALVIRFLPPSALNLVVFLQIIMTYNLLLGFFNLIPIPPLDGSNILFSLLPEKFSEIKNLLFKFGPFLLIFFVFFGFGYLSVFVSFVSRLLLGTKIIY
jgi:Zn-dependent protease